jgi:MoxR-like ATPase
MHPVQPGYAPPPLGQPQPQPVSGPPSWLGTAGSAEPDPGADAARAALGRLRAEVGKIVIGQDAVLTSLVIALLCQGHVLLEGVPGTAKTLLVRTLAAALSLDTKRVQFTPDLMPGDVTG